MTAAERARAKRKLIELRDEVVREGDVEIEPARKDPSDVARDGDAEALNEMTQVIASKRNRSRADVLARVNAALLRLEGDPELFGLCRECEEPIGKRLQLLPYVELCVECQQALDGSPKGGSRRHLSDFNK